MTFPLSAVPHVIPLGDLMEHSTDVPCWCNPAFDVIDGVPMLLHSSLDGRERFER